MPKGADNPKESAGTLLQRPREFNKVADAMLLIKTNCMSVYWFEAREIAVLIGQPVKNWQFHVVQNHTDHKESEQDTLKKIPFASSSEISNTRWKSNKEM